MEVRVHVGAYRVAGVAGAGGVVAELRRERKSGLQVGDGGERPAGEGGVGGGTEAGADAMTAAEGKIVTAVERDDVANVGGGGTPVKVRTNRAR